MTITCPTLPSCCPNPASLPCIVEKVSVEGVTDAEGSISKHRALVAEGLVEKVLISIKQARYHLVPFMPPQLHKIRGLGLHPL